MECKSCGHKHGIWDADNMKIILEDTEKFLEVQGEFTVSYTCNSWDQDAVKIYACPKCLTIRLGNRW